jgi:luciferase family oxidoreductase group 1
MRFTRHENSPRTNSCEELKGDDVHIGILDFSAVRGTQQPVDALRETMAAAPILESLGYHSLWLGEHYNASIAHSSPDMFAGIMSGLTTSMRVGVAGILLNAHSPLRVASAFRLLAALYPDRIDLGLARGMVDETRLALLRESNPYKPTYEYKVSETVGLVRQSGTVQVSPLNTPPPKVWLLGSGIESARLAAANGTAFCFAVFLEKTADAAKCAIELYRRNFCPNPWMEKPECAIALAGICVNTGREALDELDPTVQVRNRLLGTPPRFEEFFAAYAPDNITYFVFLEMSTTQAGRMASYRNLAKAFIAPKSTS